MNSIRKKLEVIYHKIVAIFFTFLGKLPKKNMYFFESFHGKQFSDNPRAIYEYIQGNHPEIKCVWSVKKGFESNFDDHQVPYVIRMSFSWLFTMPRAKYWVCNTRLPEWMKKDKTTIYIQTWHGTPLKKLGCDIDDVVMPGTTTEKYKRNIFKESKRWDYLISPNRYSSIIFRSAFKYEGEILEIGYPRNDLLINQKNKNQQDILKHLGIPEGSDVILYAPTWRDTEFYTKGKYKYINYFPFDQMIKRNPNAIIILRVHYLIGTNFDSSRYGDRVIDCSDYSDIRDLYLVASILITDYSSVMFDFAHTGKPMIYYLYDFEEYSNTIRGLYFDPNDVLPGPIVRTQDELLSEVEYILLGKVDEEGTDYCEKYKQFEQKFCLKNTKSSSEQFFDYIEGKRNV